LNGTSSGVVVLAWTRISARQVDLAHQLSGEVEIVYPDRASKNSLVRYLLSAIQTFRFLRSSEYEVLIVTAPPIEAALVCAIFRRKARPFLLDSHPGAFGLSGDTHSRRLQFVHRWLWRRADSVLVTTEELAKTVSDGGGRALVFHEPMARWQELGPTFVLKVTEGASEVLRVFVPFIFTRDEPVDLLFDVARQLQEVEFRVTGNQDRLSNESIIPPNVTLLGFLHGEEFLAEMNNSDVVLVLSTERQSVMRTAYEAIRLGRPLVVSKTEATLRYFPFALHTENTDSEISKTLRSLLEENTDVSLRRSTAAMESSQVITDLQTEELRQRIARATASRS